MDKGEAMSELICDICGKPETINGNNGKVKRLAEDHCHETGQWRGRLCQRCNTALGLFNDDIEILKRAIEYLQDDHRKKYEDYIKSAYKLRYPNQRTFYD